LPFYFVWFLGWSTWHLALDPSSVLYLQHKLCSYFDALQHLLSCLVHAGAAAKVPHWGGRRCACSLSLRLLRLVKEGPCYARAYAYALLLLPTRPATGCQCPCSTAVVPPAIAAAAAAADAAAAPAAPAGVVLVLVLLVLVLVLLPLLLVWCWC
jgi:hypothetical protein